MAPTSRERVLAAAMAEFAARGFDGAKVDRIAERAGLNKAMLYYHFPGKAALYREILRDVFAGVADAVEAIRRGNQPPDAQLRAFVATVAAEAVARPHFPSLWLREMADGGRHLDAPIVDALARVLGALTGILRDGERAGLFRRANPFVTHLGIVSPLLMFAATAGVRVKFGGRIAPAAARLDRGAAVRQVQDATLAALAPTRAARRRVRSRSPRRGRRSTP